MDPVLFDLGAVRIYWYSVLFVIGLILGYFLLLRLGRERNVKKKVLEDYFIWTVISLIVGARLFEVLLYAPKYYFANPSKIFQIWEGGLASHGAILGILIMTFFFARSHKLRFYQLSDLIAVPAALLACLVRIGNFINRELIGTVTTSLVGVQYKGRVGLRHPVQIYQSCANFILFIVLYKFRKMREGFLTWIFIGLYSVLRFFTEFYKELPANYGFFWFGLNLAQWFSVAGVIFSLVFLYGFRKKRLNS